MSYYKGYYTAPSSSESSSSSHSDSGSRTVSSFSSGIEDDFEYDDSYAENYNYSLKRTSYNDNSSYFNSKKLKSSPSSHYGSNSNTSTVTDNLSYGNPVNPVYNINNTGFQHLANSPPPSLSPELTMPVFQTLDRGNSWADDRAGRMSCRSNNDVADSESWAWSSGRKWDLVVPGGGRRKLSSYTAPPTAETFNIAPAVKGGFGEKMLEKMGWRAGEGLGKSKDGTINPIKVTQIKTDRKGLTSQEDGPKLGREDAKEKSKAKFAAMKSSSFWSWHMQGMKGPENINTRLKLAKKEIKQNRCDKIDLSGKHPVSALMELCQKRGWTEPKFSEERGVGGFKFRVEVSGMKYEPPGFCDNKKSAKRECAKHCLVTMGLMSS